MVRRLLPAVLAGGLLGLVLGSARALAKILAHDFFHHEFYRTASGILARAALFDFFYFAVGFLCLGLLFGPSARSGSGWPRAAGLALMSCIALDWLLRTRLLVDASDRGLTRDSLPATLGALGERVLFRASGALGDSSWTGGASLLERYWIVAVGLAVVGVVAILFLRWFSRRIDGLWSLVEALPVARLAVASVSLTILLGVGHTVSRGARSDGVNVLLVLVDTLRADHLGVYGYEKDTSPRLDEFARRSVVLENVVSQSSWTKTSMPSLVTSTYPSENGMLGLPDVLDPKMLTLAEVLREEGYRTAAYQTNTLLQERWGLGDGFDEYFPLPYTEHAGDEVTQLAVDWLERKGDDPFLLYVHLMDVHSPYAPPDEFKRFGDRDIDLYDGEILFTDHNIGILLDCLERTGLYEETIIVIASDHGEEFGEHGGTGHNRTLYQEVVHVPLIIGGAGARRLEGLRIERNAGNIDLVPTLLELAGSPHWKHEQFRGESLLRNLGGDARDRLIFSHVGLNVELPNTEIVSAVAPDGLKMILTKSTETGTDSFELFDLGSVESEQANLYGQFEIPMVETMREQIGWYRALSDVTRFLPGAREADGEAVRQLRALGYLE